MRRIEVKAPETPWLSGFPQLRRLRRDPLGEALQHELDARRHQDRLLRNRAKYRWLWDQRRG